MAKDTLAASAPSSPLDEAAWLEQARAGDMNALSRLITRYQDRVLNTCWRVCGNLDDARDLTQEVFLRAIESLGGFRQRAGFYTWLYRIAVNMAISHRRKSARSVRLSLHGGDGDVIADQPAARIVGRVSNEPQDPPARLSAREIEARVVDELSALDDEHRVVIVLRDLESLDYADIAEILEVPIGTVKSRLHRARMALREKLQPYMRTE